MYQERVEARREGETLASREPSALTASADEGRTRPHWRGVVTATVAFVVAVAPSILPSASAVEPRRKLLRSSVTRQFGGRVAPISATDVAVVIDEAAALWGHVDLPAVRIRVADLAGDQLATTRGTTITVDPTAAGNGWFVDPTPDRIVGVLPSRRANRSRRRRQRGRRAHGPGDGDRARARSRAGPR